MNPLEEKAVKTAMSLENPIYEKIPRFNLQDPLERETISNFYKQESPELATIEI